MLFGEEDGQIVERDWGDGDHHFISMLEIRMCAHERFGKLRRDGRWGMVQPPLLVDSPRVVGRLRQSHLRCRVSIGSLLIRIKKFLTKALQLHGNFGPILPARAHSLWISTKAEGASGEEGARDANNDKVIWVNSENGRRHRHKQNLHRQSKH